MPIQHKHAFFSLSYIQGDRDDREKRKDEIY